MAVVGSMGVGLGSNKFKVMKDAAKENMNYNPELVVEDSMRGYKEFYIRNIGGVGGVESVKLGPFYFVIEPEENYALQLNSARIEATCSVVRADGSKLQDLHDVVGPINGLGGTMWESVEPRINNQPMSGASCVNSGLKYFMDTILSRGQDALHTHLLLQMFHMDSPGEYDNLSLPMTSFRKMFQEAIESGKLNLEVPEAMKRLRADTVFNENRQRVPAERIEEENKRRKKLRDKWYDDQFWLLMGVDPEREQTMSLLEIHKEECNLGFQTRCRIVAGSEKFTMISPIPHDLFNLSNYLGPMNRLDLKLMMYPHRFLLNTFMYNRGYELRLHDLKLHLRSVRLKESIPARISETYEMNETHLYKHVVPHHLTNYSFRIQHAGVLPKTIVLAMVRTAAVEGNYQLNPFNFDNFNVTKISLFINGEERPQGGLTFDFKRKNADAVRGYHWLFANTGALGNRGNLISYAHFQTGAFIVPFDLTPDRCNGVHRHNAELGYIDVNFTWGGEGLKEPITILYELVFNKLMINDKGTGQLSIVDVVA
jgi:hypothetical protein